MKFANRIEKLPPYLFYEISKRIAEWEHLRARQHIRRLTAETK